MKLKVELNLKKCSQRKSASCNEVFGGFFGKQNSKTDPVGDPKSGSLVEGQQDFHLHITGFKQGPSVIPGFQNGLYICSPESVSTITKQIIIFFSKNEFVFQF